MKIILAGLWETATYQQNLSKALRRSGIIVIPFRTRDTLKGILGFFETYFVIRGPLHRLCDYRLINMCKTEQPDIVFVWQYDSLGLNALVRIRKQTAAKIVCYTNDDPFSPAYDSHRSYYVRKRWRHFKRAIPLYDKHYVHRRHNLADFKKAGATAVELLYSSYNPENEYPRQVSNQERKRFECDVIFIGHFEDGIKRESFKRLLEEKIDLKIFGQYGWNKPEATEIRKLYGKKIVALWGDDYAKALSSAKIGLCFLSRLNRDEYTTRSFEIPACGTLLLAERTPAHQKLYIEGKEAEFFEDVDELVKKIKFLLANPEHLQKIALNGRERLLRDGHSIDDRAGFLMNQFQEMLSR